MQRFSHKNQQEKQKEEEGEEEKKMVYFLYVEKVAGKEETKREHASVGEG